MIANAKKSTKKEGKKAKKEKTNTGLSAPLYNQKGEVIKKVKLPENIFGQKPNPVLISQAVRVYSSKQKPQLASTKTRSQVRGGGRKPHRQKGTGRARAGTIRAPGRVGGGVVFGPHPTVSELKLNKKTRQKALSVSLSDKTKTGGLILIDEFTMKEPKTKKAIEILKKITPEIKGPIRLVLDGEDNNVVKSFRNIKGIEISRVLDLNMLNVLKSSGLIFTLEALEGIKKRFGETNVKSN
jgi:large subunit ribosomal protein L4